MTPNITSAYLREMAVIWRARGPQGRFVLHRKQHHVAL